MVAFNVSLDDASPLISYAGTWSDTPLGDSLAVNYNGSSFHTTNATGASATFAFNGTGVWFYGAHRPGYGSYSLTVDGQSVASGSVASSSPIFDQFLGGSQNLSMGQHTAVLSSTGGAIDLDSLIFETSIGSQDAQVNQTSLNDNDSRISYTPASAWQVSDQSFFANGSAHYTQTNGSQATLSFTGDAVAVYGGVSFDHGLYTVSVDGQAKQLNGGGYVEYHPKTMLYFAQGLGAGSHNLVVTSDSGFLDLDSMVVYSATGNKNGTDAPTSPMNNGGNTDTFHINQSASPGNNANSGAATTVKSIAPAVLAAIIGASIVGLVSIILIAIFVAQQIRKRHQLAAAEAAADVESPTFIQNPSPDLEAGRGGYHEKDGGADLQRSNSRWTLKSIASNWSQSSYHSRSQEPAPPVPELPPGLPTLTVPIAPLNIRRPAERSSTHSGSSGSATLHSDDGHGSYDRKSGLMVDEDHYRGSIDSSDSSIVSAAPRRPARPAAGLDLTGMENIDL